MAPQKGRRSSIGLGLNLTAAPPPLEISLESPAHRASYTADIDSGRFRLLHLDKSTARVARGHDLRLAAEVLQSCPFIVTLAFAAVDARQRADKPGGAGRKRGRRPARSPRADWPGGSGLRECGARTHVAGAILSSASPLTPSNVGNAEGCVEWFRVQCIARARSAEESVPSVKQHLLGPCGGDRVRCDTLCSWEV